MTTRVVGEEAEQLLDGINQISSISSSLRIHRELVCWRGQFWVDLPALLWPVIRMMRRPDHEKVVGKSLVMRKFGTRGRNGKGGGIYGCHNKVP